MSEPFVAEIRIFAGNFAPRGFAMCDGQLLAINQNESLFSLLGTTYGGDGRTTFALPDLRGRVPVHPGTGPGLSPRRLGEKGGEETVASGAAEVREVPAVPRGPQRLRRGGAVGQPEKLTVAGGGATQNNMPPYLGVNFVIALMGLYPSRS